MAIDAKMAFLRQAEEGLSSKLTQTDMVVCLSIVSDILEGFDVRQVDMYDENVPDDLLTSFVASMLVQGRSKKTMFRYAYIIKRFMDFAKVSTRKVNVYHIRNWLAHEKARGIADSTLEGNRQVLSSYFGWLFRESLIDKNPMANVGVIKVAKKKKLTYTDIEFAKLNECCYEIRDRAILHFLASSGCRVSEMTELNRDSVDLYWRECIVHGKGNKERKVYISDVAAMLIEQYLESRTDNNEALFVGRRGERLQPGGVRIMLNKIGNLAGVEHVHPHKFRRTYATNLARRGMPVQEVQHLLGHDKIDTTMAYVMINEEDTKQDYRKFA